MAKNADSAAQARFLGLVRDGRGLKYSARTAGVHLDVGYQWLRAEFFLLREGGLDCEQARGTLGGVTSKVAVWEASFISGNYNRHHLRVEPSREKAFWSAFAVRRTVRQSAVIAGVWSSTAYRWIEQRYYQLRADGVSETQSRRRLRLSKTRAGAWESRRALRIRKAERGRDESIQVAVRECAARIAAELAPKVAQEASKLSRTAVRGTRYWELIARGETNIAASTLVGVTRQTGINIQRRARQRKNLTGADVPSERYLSLVERLQIADLDHLKLSIRAIAQGDRPGAVDGQT